MTHSEAYEQTLLLVELAKNVSMTSIVSIIKTINVHPLTIGNMVYYYTEYKGKEVPAYCYKSDYEKGGKFLPIYDEENSGEFGWSDFGECCRIFDVIEREVFRI